MGFFFFFGGVGFDVNNFPNDGRFDLLANSTVRLMVIIYL